MGNILTTLWFPVFKLRKLTKILYELFFRCICVVLALLTQTQRKKYSKSTQACKAMYIEGKSYGFLMLLLSPLQSRSFIKEYVQSILACYNNIISSRTSQVSNRKVNTSPFSLIYRAVTDNVFGKRFSIPFKII
ncbi:hypothetical protein C8N28_1739 [Albibacterium bauzanense]|uniref:Uncharacterized protein n=1 Tax=Albibacterium bauzanense TaxID=653929 RepID=A0A4R1M0U3_9SPHI|nr:hypothetical protein C8N28_1739 [Albibacterium bauzanense]